MKSSTDATIELTMKKLSFIIKHQKILEINAGIDPEILDIAYDSRLVRPGSLFAALEGFHTDGHRFIEEARERGAAAILHSKRLPLYHRDTAYARVEDSRRALSSISAAFFDHPSEKLITIGVTGTDGKSTTVWLIHQLLEALGASSGFISTVNFKTDRIVEKNSLRQSTPEAPHVHRLLKKMADTGKEYAVIEATSHGLSGKTSRLGDVRFAAAVFTNLTHEHLEFHGSLEQYRSDKANLFRALSGPDRVGVVNLDDPNHRFFSEQAGAPVYTYSRKNDLADLYAFDFRPDIRGTDFSLHFQGREEKARLNLPGLYNVENLLAAALTVMRLLKAPLQELSPLFPGLKGVRGRLETIEMGQPFSVIVDYAHTPESFEKLFSLLREYMKGSLIAVFGSAGERDLEKRAKQGRIASRFCDLLVLADEDPRGEDGPAIIREIASGCRGLEEGKDLFLIPDRREAIRFAFSKARKEDAVLLLGKGHEESIIYAGGPVKWDEAGVAGELLMEMGFGE